jgi:pimeloyl-ACP methyl ester carboxylesterase
VFLHGEAVTGAGYEATLEAEEGWFTFFLRRGFAVFTTDWPSVGRSAFAGKENHDKLLTNTKIAEDVVELLDRLGPAILVTKSWSGTVGWMVADMRPHLVRGIVALSPRVLGSKLSYRLPLAFDDRGEATEFFPANQEEINPAGDPDFTGDFLRNAPEVEPRDWIERLNPGWYDREIGEDGLYTYVNGPGRVPISRGVRDQLQVPLTPVGSEARPTQDVTFSASKIVVIIGQGDPMKSLEYGHNLVELKTAGVSSAEFLALSAENGFPEEGADLEYGKNSSRIAEIVFDWMRRQDLAKEVPVRD